MIGGPYLRYVRAELPLAQCTSTTAVTQFTTFVLFGCACSEWPPGLGYFNIYYILSSPPPDGPSSGTESSRPVNHPTPGIQIVDQSGSCPYL